MQASEATVAPSDRDASAEASSGVAGATREERLQRLLKVIVIGLALVLLAGLALVIGRVIYLASSARTEGVQVAAPTLAIRPEQRLELPRGAQVRSVSLSGNRLAVHYDADGATGIAVLDLQSGRKITNVGVDTKAAGD